MSFYVIVCIYLYFSWQHTQPWCKLIQVIWRLGCNIVKTLVSLGDFDKGALPSEFLRSVPYQNIGSLGICYISIERKSSCFFFVFFLKCLNLLIIHLLKRAGKTVKLKQIVLGTDIHSRCHLLYCVSACLISVVRCDTGSALTFVHQLFCRFCKRGE